MTSPLVSIVIPCYNAVPWVGAAIESALSQTWSPLEVLVHDDGSTDGSAEVIERFGDRVIATRGANQGQNASRNHLTNTSHGEWVAFLDADDEFPVTHIATMMAHIEGAQAVYSSVEKVFYEGSRVFDRHMEPAEDFADPWCAAFLWRYPNTSSFLIRRDAVLDAGGWNEEVHNCTDYALYFDLLLNGATFRAASDTSVTYRHWSATQAVYQNDRRRCQTRIGLMWTKALAKEDSSSPLTPTQKTAFEEALFGCVRQLYTIDRSAASAEYRKLKQWNPKWAPHGAAAPFSYRSAHAILGFMGAEKIAAAMRAVRRGPQSAGDVRFKFNE